MAKRRSHVRVGALVVLACCFVVSALVRVGDVIAALPESEANSDYVNEPLDRESKTAGESAIGAVRAPKDVIAELRRQRELLNAREAELAAREHQLQAVDKRLTDRLEQLKAERKRLAATAATVHDAAGKDVRRLSEIYGTMKPKQAAQIFDKMAPSFAAGFLTEMRSGAAALIMANMEADKAYAVSLLIAGRNVRPPAEKAASEAGTTEPAAPDEITPPEE